MSGDATAKSGGMPGWGWGVIAVAVLFAGAGIGAYYGMAGIRGSFPKNPDAGVIQSDTGITSEDSEEPTSSSEDLSPPSEEMRGNSHESETGNQCTIDPDGAQQCCDYPGDVLEVIVEGSNWTIVCRPP